MKTEPHTKKSSFTLPRSLLLILAALITGCLSSRAPLSEADTIYFNGKIITADSAFTVTQAVAIKGEKFLALGTDKEILAYAGERTAKVDLEGRTVIPGLIEAHAHPERAGLSEIDEPLPNPRTVEQCLAWIKAEAGKKKAGEWIIHPKLFATRLREMRPPSLAELDSAAPNNPVFLNGSYGGSINSVALRVSGIGEKADNPGVLRDPVTGKLTGQLRFTALPLLKLPEQKKYTLEERAGALEEMLKRYNRVGFTSFTSGAITPADTALYHYLKEQGRLSIRAYLNIYDPFPFKEAVPAVLDSQVAALGFKTGDGDQWVRIGALKTLIDGGICTGTAYLRQPWGPKAREIFGVTDPNYRGIPKCTAAEFAKLVHAGALSSWKITAHATGGGAVDLMLEAFEQVDLSVPIAPLRCSIIHGNFYTAEAISRMKKLNIIADIQPAWFYKDGDAMLYILGPERVRDFLPLRSLLDAGVVVSLGSDHMVILDDKESINPYSPWLAIWSMVTRKTENGTLIVPEEAITREEALRCYTINSAYASFEEELKGTIEPGKLADMAVLEKDLLTCPVDEIKDMNVKMTVVGGKVVYQE